MLAVASFYVDRRAEYPDAVEYVPLLKILERSCVRLGFDHIVLTDYETQNEIRSAGLLPFAPECKRDDLPRNLMRALTEAQAQWLEQTPWPGHDTLFVGADCVIRRDFRDALPLADLSIILRPGHKRHRINNGFMYVPAASLTKVAALFRKIADDCGSVMCDDMVAIERALSPMPDVCCLTERAGLTVNFLPMGIWNGGPKTADDNGMASHVLHFRGKERKKVMLDWAERWMPA